MLRRTSGGGGGGRVVGPDGLDLITLNHYD
jgi:hypothetical protein